jgi:AbrB family looped-hinge helix DNA binding protein
VAKVTSKLQVTIPKSLARQCGISPGDDIGWTAAADGIRLTPAEARPRALSAEARLELFDAATGRQARRQRGKARAITTGRGWTRDELYDRGRSR